MTVRAAMVKNARVQKEKRAKKEKKIPKTAGAGPGAVSGAASGAASSQGLEKVATAVNTLTERLLGACFVFMFFVVHVVHVFCDPGSSSWSSRATGATTGTQASPRSGLRGPWAQECGGTSATTNGSESTPWSPPMAACARSGQRSRWERRRARCWRCRTWLWSRSRQPEAS